MGRPSIGSVLLFRVVPNTDATRKHNDGIFNITITVFVKRANAKI